MKSAFLNIKKYILLYLLFVKNCIIAEMEFRLNFIMGLFVECAWLVSKILYAVVLYKSGVVIEGYSPDAMLIFVGMHTFMTGILISLFWPNYGRLTQYVKEGTLDMFITKPVSLQFMATLRYISFGTLIPNVLGGMIMIIMGMQKSLISLSLKTFLAFVLFSVSGAIISYSIFLLPQLLAFRIMEMGPINAISGQVQEVNNVPVIIYSKWIQRIGIYVFPIFAVSNFFPLFVLGSMSVSYIIWTFICPVVFFVLVRLLWNSAIRNYTSASS